MDVDPAAPFPAEQFASLLTKPGSLFSRHELTDVAKIERQIQPRQPWRGVRHIIIYNESSKQGHVLQFRCGTDCTIEKARVCAAINHKRGRPAYPRYLLTNYMGYVFKCIVNLICNPTQFLHL